MKALITGINGFVGKYLETELKNNNYEVYGIDITGKRENVFTLDLAHKESVLDIIKNVNPDYIFHLAGQASVKESWNIPLETLHCNVDNAVNLLDAMYSECRESRLVIVGSADEYGIVSADQCPLKETRALHPSTPYAISKQTQESIVGCLAKVRNMDVVFARPFNHTGPGQKRGFVIPDFAARIIEIKKYGGDMKIGNLKAKRDFSDVRDVVRAYRLLAEKGRRGEVYNVGSGEAFSIEWILYRMLEIAGISPEVTCDTDNLRPLDMPIFVADCSKILFETGYSPQIRIEDTLREVLDFYAKQYNEK